MAQRVYEDCFVQISTVERLKMRFFAFLFGLWIVLKHAFWTLWKPEKKSTENRDKPITCLVDNTLGYHSYIKLQSVKLHYVEVGDKNSPLLVLLHGFPDCWLGWRHQMKLFSSHFRVIAVDLKGFGDSDKPAWRRNYKIKTIVQELHELITSLDSYRCTIIGHDLGAHVGWYFVTCYPDLVDNFVAISCPHPNVFWNYLPNSSRFNSRWMNVCQLPLLPEIEASKNDIAIIEDCFNHLKKEDKLIDAYKYVFSRTEDWTGPINYYRNLPHWRIHQDYRVIVPTLLIVGSKDPYIQLESVVKSTEFAKKFLLKIVDGAGHFPHQENPELVNKLLLSFLTVQSPPCNPSEKTEASKGLIGSLYSNTMKYGSSLVDNVKKTTNGVVWLPSLPSQMLTRNNS